MTVELTSGEIEFLRSLLVGVPLQGNFVSMEKTVATIAALLAKLAPVEAESSG